MNLAQLAQERLQRQQARERQQAAIIPVVPVKTMSDSKFLDMLFNEYNQERIDEFEKSLADYLKTNARSVADDYYRVMDQYSVDMGKILENDVKSMLPDLLTKVLSELDEYTCALYDYPDVSSITEKYNKAVSNIRLTKSRVEKLLDNHNTKCYSTLTSILDDLNKVIDELTVFTKEKRFKRTRLMPTIKEKLNSLKVRSTNFVDICWNGAFIPGEEKFINSDGKLFDKITFDANLLIDIVAKENKLVMDEITNGDAVCDGTNYVCSCIQDNIISSIVLKMGLKEKYLKGDLDFGRVYYEYSAIWNLVNQNLPKVELFDATTDMLIILENQRVIRNNILVEMNKYVTEAIEKINTFGEFLPGEVELRLLLTDIFNIFRVNLGLEFDVQFEIVENEQASEALARRLQNQM